MAVGDSRCQAYSTTAATEAAGAFRGKATDCMVHGIRAVHVYLNTFTMVVNGGCSPLVANQTAVCQLRPL
jgi:hypothetical protein